MTGSIALDLGVVVVAVGCGVAWLRRKLGRVKRAVFEYDEEAKRLSLTTELKDDKAA